MKNAEVSFSGYFKAIRISAYHTGKTISDKFFQAWSVAVFFFSLIYLGLDAMPMLIYPFGLMYVFYLMSNAVQRGPSLLNLVPIGYKRKVSYFFLSSLLLSLICLLALIGAALFFSLFMILFVLLVGGEVTSTPEDSEVQAMFCPKTEILAAIMIFVCIGIAFIASFIKNKKAKKIFGVAAPIAIFLPHIIFGAVNNIQKGTFFSGGFEEANGNVIFLIAYAVLSAAVFVIGTVKAVCGMKTKDF